MSFWFEHIGEPLCSTHEEAVKYLDAELARAVPTGWTVERISGPRTAWRISRDNIPDGEWPGQEYGVIISTALDLVVFTHGNNDIGALGIHHLLLNARVIDSVALREFGMTACIKQLFADCRPNEWGYT